jgi:hypothetical protein
MILGLLVDMNKMMVAITGNYIQHCHDLLKLWDPTHRFFEVGDMQKLVGKLARLGEAVPWIYKLMTHLYTFPRVCTPKQRQAPRRNFKQPLQNYQANKNQELLLYAIGPPTPFELCDEESCKDDQQEWAPLSNQLNYARGIKFHFATLVT